VQRHAKRGATTVLTHLDGMAIPENIDNLVVASDLTRLTL
jgi:hypothetical protein